MDIAALSVVMANNQVREQASISIAAKVMDTAKVQSSELIKMMEQSVAPDIGRSIDIKL